MGYRNVGFVVGLYGDLSGNAHKVLTCMAFWAHDDGRPPRYFKGPDDLLLSMGRINPMDGDTSPGAVRARDANAEALRAAVAELRRRGLVTYAVKPAKGRTAEYHLHLEPTLERGVTQVSTQENPGAQPRKTLGSRAGLPRKTLGMPQENPGPIEKRQGEQTTGEIQSPLATTSPALPPKNDQGGDPSDEATRQHRQLALWEAAKAREA